MSILLTLYALVLTGGVGAEVAQTSTIIDAQTISLLCGVVIPLLVGLLAKINASDGLKAVINALLSALAGTLATFTQTGLGAGVDWKTLVISILSVWVVSVATYYGVYKPTGVAGSLAAATPKFGFGPRPVLETDDKGVEDTA
jgi:hypothetical protein